LQKKERGGEKGEEKAFFAKFVRIMAEREMMRPVTERDLFPRWEREGGRRSQLRASCSYTNEQGPCTKEEGEG